MNAAWGHMCLLLDVLRKRVGVDGRNCTLLPLGSKSCIKVPPRAKGYLISTVAGMKDQK